MYIGWAAFYWFQLYNTWIDNYPFLFINNLIIFPSLNCNFFCSIIKHQISTSFNFKIIKKYLIYLNLAPVYLKTTFFYFIFETYSNFDKIYFFDFKKLNNIQIFFLLFFVYLKKKFPFFWHLSMQYSSFFRFNLNVN